MDVVPLFWFVTFRVLRVVVITVDSICALII